MDFWGEKKKRGGVGKEIFYTKKGTINYGLYYFHGSNSFKVSNLL
jgi:hypothetical protein